MSTDLERLPLRGAVLELRDDGERTRVTFRRLAGIYWLDRADPAYAELRAALDRSRTSGAELALTYALAGMRINGLS